MEKFMKKSRLLLLLLVVVLILSSCSKSVPVAKVNSENWKTNYTYVFCHGLSGWGSYDKQNKYLKYWGMRTGDLLGYLNEQGFNCVSASVAPHGSAWDRACELYAQLMGTVVDYGKEHSERCNHERFGTDYSKSPLIEKWDSENKINLIGHSFGGATVRLLSELMANGSEAERAATDESELSELFKGGKKEYINSITALASPHNGTTAYDINPEDKAGSGFQNWISGIMANANDPEQDGRAEYDFANYDMFIDNAIELNSKIETLENVYYFSVPCNSSIIQDDGTYAPDEDKTEAMFVRSGILMGKLTETTTNGFVVDESWYMNDGLVNTVSAYAPLGAPQKEYDENVVQRGMWNIMPIYDGDHMSLQGGFAIKNDVREFYLKHLDMINKL
jgi:triacylglycerol lipase